MALEQAKAGRPKLLSPLCGMMRCTEMGDLVRKLLEKAGLNYRQAEEQLGGDRTSWFRCANDERGISDESLARLAQAAGIDPQQVVGYALMRGIQHAKPSLHVFRIPKVRRLLKDVLALMQDS